MSLINPLPPDQATDKVAQTYGRLKDMFGEMPIPAPFLTAGRVPAFLQDLYMNFKKFVWTDGPLDARTKAALALGVSSALRSAEWTPWYAERCRAVGWSEQSVADVLAITATCQMYNIFFKFRDISGSDIFNGMGVGLRAHAFSNTTLDERTVELLNIAISDINGCKPCTSGHVQKARELGATDEMILETVQCAATVAAGCAFSSAGALGSA